MNPSVDLPQLNEASSDKKETVKLVNQMRRRLNDRFTQVISTTTFASGAWTTVYSAQMPLTAVWAVSCTTSGRARSGDGRVFMTQLATFHREGGVPIQDGPTTAVVIVRNIVAFDQRFNINGNFIEWQVIDDGARTLDWAVECSYQEIPRS